MNAICELMLVPVRSEPSDKSEMVTQLLFGETFSLLEDNGNWILIKAHFDGYEGWIDKKQATLISDDFLLKIKSHGSFLVTSNLAACRELSGNLEYMLLRGSQLPLIEKDIFQVGDKNFVFSGTYSQTGLGFDNLKVVPVCLSYLNTPYLWGGRSIAGIDCSGLVQVAYNECGMKMPRNASQQASLGETIDFVDETLPGDLAFFDNLSGDITHVGIIIGDRKILHASGKVRIDHLDHNGIYNSETNNYSHKLRIIKRFIE